jgi:VCBS repeat-containing protein
VTVGVAVASVNKAPVAVDDSASVEAKGTITGFNILSTDTDVNNDSLSVTAVTNVPGSGGGKFTITNTGIVTFNTNSSFDSLTEGQEKTTTYSYKVSDGKLTDTGLITVTVRGVKAGVPVSTSPVTTVTGDTTVTSRGQNLSGSGSMDTATLALGSKGIMVSAINYWSKLGRELKLANDKIPAYVVLETGASAAVNGKTLSESYWTLFEDTESKGGSALTGSAVTTSLLFGSILTNFEKVVGTDNNDQMYGREANDYFVTKKGSDVVNGGAGTDTIRLLGNSADYTIVQKSSYYQLTSSQSSVSVSNVEYLEFDDGKFTTEAIYNRPVPGSVLGASTSVTNTYVSPVENLILQLHLLEQLMNYKGKE